MISIASGKGGTGKTTLSTALAWVAGLTGDVVFLDCDVEEPDAHFYLKPDWSEEREVSVSVPAIDEARCNGCGRCADFCRYNALAVIKGSVLTFPELCHSCGGCLLACPLKCISETERRIGVIREGRSGNITLRQGLLDIGEPVAVSIIRQLKSSLEDDALIIADCPPGTGCNMVSSVEASDFCILVTEPSPFGRHDLELAHRVALELEIRHGVVINRAAPSNRIIEDYCESEGIECLGKIPYDRRIAEFCSRGEILPEIAPAWREEISRMLERVTALCPSSL